MKEGRSTSHVRGERMLHIGILAHSADGAALCLLEMIRESARALGPHLHPEITLSILPMGEVLGAWERTDLETVNRHLMHSAERLKSAGCDFFVCPDNTAHIALDAATAPYPLPGLHIADIVAETATADGRRRLALLGTRWTMEGPPIQRPARAPDSRCELHRAKTGCASIGSSSTSYARGSSPLSLEERSSA